MPYFTHVDDKPLEDKVVSGKCTMARMRIGDYLSWVTVKDHMYQRNIINVNKHKVYQKLVTDLLKGAIIPPISLVLPDYSGQLDTDTDMTSIKAFILDGLQRTNCLNIACDELNKSLPNMLEYVSSVDTSQFLSLRQFLDNEIRLEIWTELKMRSILYKMVSLNTGRVQMSIEHQLEILQLPLKGQIEQATGCKVWLETELSERTQRLRKEAGEFTLSLIVTGMIGYAKQDYHFSKTSEAVEMIKLDENEQMREADLVTSRYGESDLNTIVGTVAPAFFKKYVDAPNKEALPENAQLLMCDNETFFVPMMAALGLARAQAGADTSTHDQITSRVLGLVTPLQDPTNTDPLGLIAYHDHIQQFRSRIGYRRRRLVFEFFRELFSRDNKQIDLLWKVANNTAKA